MSSRYKSLSIAPIFLSSVLAIRCIVGFVTLIGISLIISIVSGNEGMLALLMVSTSVFIFIYIISRFSSILYNSTDIVVQNIYGKEIFKRKDFLSITPWLSYINIYIIKFKDGQSFLFSTGPNIFIGDGTVKEAEELKKKLFNETLVEGNRS